MNKVNRILNIQGRRVYSSSFIPQCHPATPSDIREINNFLSDKNKLLIFTGAGISTESGIPDYRSEGVGLYSKSDRRPMNHQDFLKSKSNRQRYWARNFVGWPQFSGFQPNESHYTIRKLEETGKVIDLVTQNVDALHRKAGSISAQELHGCTHRVKCLSCFRKIPRHELQHIFKQMNPDFEETSTTIAPDGDMVLSEEQINGFQVPDCPSCGGILKPDVVFFGDNVRVPTVKYVFNQVESCDSVLVCGSSLHVYSVYRFISRAHNRQKPIAVINIGPTRGDSIITLKVSARCGDVLPQIQF